MCGLLLVRPGDLVGVERFVDELWPERPPSDARALVRGYVSRLRRALRRGPSNADRVITRKPGYLLRIEDQELDLHRFERLVADARRARQDRQAERVVELLDRADRLWRGDPFADVPRTNSITAATMWLTERRLAAVEERFDAMLSVGRHEHILAELAKFVTANPLRERLAGQFMLALYRCGRQAEALARFQATRNALAREVGVAPGDELRQLHQRILTGDATLHALPTTTTVTPRPVPRQLPRDLPVLVGRDRDVASLRAKLRTRDRARPGPVVVIHGPPGVGKTALATRVAHETADWYPHGQLHVNLCGFTTDVAPMSAAAALGQMLRALGVSGTEIPPGIEEAAALFRTALAKRRVLIVLDNAATAAHVRHLLPSSPGSAVLVTSRDRLAELEGTVHHSLRPLNSAAAGAMLGELVTGDRTTREPGATARLAELCDHLPLGLHVAAARLNSRPHWTVRDLVDRLSDERQRLAELAVGDLALRSSLAVSHTALRQSDRPTDQDAARALRVLGALPVTRFDLHLVTAVLAIPLPDADRAIGRLLDAHLLEETAPGSYRMHDLIRLLAGELAAEPALRSAALTNALGHYVTTARTAVALAYPHRVHHPTPDRAVPARPLADRHEALRWLHQTRQDMVAVVRQALDGPAERAALGVWLALALHWYLYLDADEVPETIELYRDVITATNALADRRAQGCAHGSLASFLMIRGELTEARAHLLVELAIWRELGERFGEQRALGNLGVVHLRLQCPQEAVSCLREQLTLAGEIDAPIGQAFARYSLGAAYHQLGRFHLAIEQVEAGLAWFEQSGDNVRQCEGRELLARIYLELGRVEHAIELLTRSLVDARRFGYRLGELWALILLARAWRLAEDAPTARYYAEQAAVTSARFHETQARKEALTECTKLGLLVRV